MASPVSFAALSPAERSRCVKAWAGDLGFDRVGVARAEALDEEAVALRAWLARGFHAEMHWIADRPERRADPRLLLPGCRSVVAVAANYETDETGARAETGGETPREAEGRIARYARRADYHRTLGKAVGRLARRLAAAAGATGANGGALARGVAKPCVDTAPVLERAWARRAGLGFVGKNTCLVHPRHGSWFLLGVVLTTFELEPDAPVADGCGTCRRCLDACPSGALVAPGVLDATRCRSYLTVEHRGDDFSPAPPARAPDDSWLFGCDTCQEVCPYNQRASSPADPAGLLGPCLHPPTLAPSEILALEDEAALIEKLGRRSPLRRARLEGLQRNARRCAKRNPGEEPPEWKR